MQIHFDLRRSSLPRLSCTSKSTFSVWLFFAGRIGLVLSTTTMTTAEWLRQATPLCSAWTKPGEILNSHRYIFTKKPSTSDFCFVPVCEEREPRWNVNTTCTSIWEVRLLTAEVFKPDGALCPGRHDTVLPQALAAVLYVAKLHVIEGAKWCRRFQCEAFECEAYRFTLCNKSNKTP